MYVCMYVSMHACMRACMYVCVQNKLGGTPHDVRRSEYSTNGALTSVKEIYKPAGGWGGGGGGVAGKITYNVPPRAFKSRTGHCCT